MDGKIWANSGDSHLTEPGDLFEKNLPAGMAERMPRSVKDEDGSHETVYVDGQSFRRRMPRVRQDFSPEELQALMEKPKDAEAIGFVEVFTRAPGANDPKLRLQDLDDEGIWAEVIYPSLATWAFSIRDPKLVHRSREPLGSGRVDGRRAPDRSGPARRCARGRVRRPLPRVGGLSHLPARAARGGTARRTRRA
jgi:hypothetical protein